MTPEELRARRLTNQLLAAPASDPVEVVRALGAVQSQDLPGALWAVGRRSGADATAVRAALSDGRILRTHVLRPTWHLVAREDLRPLVAATGEALRRGIAPVLRSRGLDDATLDRVHAVLPEILRAGPLVREEVAARLGRAGVDLTDGVRFANALLHAEAAALVCSGPVADGRQTLALVEQRTPPEEAPRPQHAVLADLALRFFRTRGPATPAYFRWWAGLRAAPARAAVEAVRDRLRSAAVDGRELLWDDRGAPAEPPAALLLPNFDEYLVAYTDRSDVFDEAHRRFLDSRGEPIMQHVVVLDGLVAGTWRVSARARRMAVAVTLFAARPAPALAAIEEEAARFAAHRGLPVETTIVVA
ncbi:MAG: winged helix DNA-binding domain-containing protein [Amnibacterium sp.]